MLRGTIEIGRPPPGEFIPTGPSIPSTTDDPNLGDQIRRLGNSIPTTQEKPPDLHTPDQPPDIPHYPPPPPPTIYGHDDIVVCALIGDQIFFPITDDPLSITEKPIAPWDPAVGGAQVLLDTGAFFSSNSDISVPNVGLPCGSG